MTLDQAVFMLRFGYGVVLLVIFSGVWTLVVVVIFSCMYLNWGCPILMVSFEAKDRYVGGCPNFFYLLCFYL